LSRRPHRKRTIPVKGYRRDHGRYYRCWNCGFVCDMHRDALGGRPGDAVAPVGIDPTPGVLGNTGRTVLMQVGMDGQPLPVRRIFKSDVTSGCPFCGTHNWK